MDKTKTHTVTIIIVCFLLFFLGWFPNMKCLNEWINVSTGKKIKLLYIFSKQKVKCFVNIIVFFLFKLQCFILGHFTHLENNTCVVIHHALKRLSDRTVFTVFRLLTDFVCLYTYEFWLSLCKIVRSSVILFLPLWTILRGETNF